MKERILICGDRHWRDYPLVHATLHSYTPNVECVIEGDCNGADRMGGRAAISLNIPVHHYPAKWGEYGCAAGIIRNEQMLEEGHPTLVLAFHDNLGESRGTAHMIDIARQAGIPVRLINHE